jgi:hypothetical protein
MSVLRVARAFVLAAVLLLPRGVAAQAADPSADFVMPGPVVALPAALQRVLTEVRPEDLGARIGFLASPNMNGRGLGTTELEATADYIAASLKLAGLAPGVASPGSKATYFQAVPIRRITQPGGDLTIEVRTEAGGLSRSFLTRVDCLLPEIAPQIVSGPVVFAGYGIREPSLGRDDYRDLDVRGKIVAVIGGVPPGAEWQKAELLGRYAEGTGRDRYERKAEIARELGARALIALDGKDLAAALADTPSPVPYFLPAEELEPAPLPLVLASGAVAQGLLGIEAAAGEGGKPRAIPGASATIRVAGAEDVAISRNVIAVLAGSDATLRSEAVVVGAHMDHLGRVGGIVHPGADDNASGTAAVLQMASALAAASQRPKRTIVFAFWTGEEEGHLGSDYYVHHPVWSLQHTTLYANLDMIAHPWLPEEIKKLVADVHLPGSEQFLARVKPADFIEPGVAAWAPELCPVLAQAARGLGLSLHFDRTIYPLLHPLIQVCFFHP